MIKTYSQIYIQVVLAVNGRQNLIPPDHKDELHKYICGVIVQQGQNPLVVNSMPDHLHMFMAVNPNTALSALIKAIKEASAKFIDKRGWLRQPFSWQEGFGAFSYSRSHIFDVVKYIDHQEVHHKNRTFRQEYLGFLKKFGIDYDEQHVFKFLD